MKICILSLYAILFLLADTVGWSQEARGTIVGLVVDASGSVIPNADLDVFNIAMGTRLSLKSNRDGYFQAAYLIPGIYAIEAIAPGFKRTRRDAIELRINDRLEVTLSLEIGDAKESVTITSQVPLLSTGSASASTVIDARGVADLPISLGNPFALLGLAGGATFVGNARQDQPYAPTTSTGYATDGTRGNLGDITIDGAPTTAKGGANVVIASYIPPTDIVAELTVQTATFDASFGQTMGGVTNVSIRSGTNALHGSAYESVTRPSLWANDFFANAVGTPRADIVYNRWGGSVSGPIYVPRIYNGRNRTFFMWGYEGIRDTRPRNDGIPTVPTPAMKAGDFSALLAVNSSYQIYNPFTRSAIAGGRYQEQPFPENKIPASLINPVASAILRYFPSPTGPGGVDGTNNLLQPDLTEPIRYFNQTERVDHIVSERQRIFGRFSMYNRTDPSYDDYFHNLSTNNIFEFLSRTAVVDDVYTVSPATVIDVKYSYNRFIRLNDQEPAGQGFDLTSLGLPTAFNDLIPPSVRRFPQVSVTGYQGTGASGGYFWADDTHAATATLTHVHGSHAMRAGMEFRSYRRNINSFNANQSGAFTFDSTWTRGPLDNSPAAPGSLGQSVAALLLGLPSSSSSVTVASSFAEQSLAWGFFYQDDWKPIRNLTLNLGLRWEFEQPMTERYNRSVAGFDFGYVQPFSAAAQANYAKNPTPEVAANAFQSTGGLTFEGLNGSPRSLYQTPKKNLMPRFGLAYQLSRNTVLRGGYGIFYGFLGVRRLDVIQSGFSRQTPFVPSQDNGITFLNTLSNPFPNGLLLPVGAGQGPQTLVGSSLTFFNQRPLEPQMQRWEIGLQHVFKGVLAEADYVGNRGTHLEINRNLNTVSNQYLSTSPARDTTAINYLSANLPNPFLGLLPDGATSSFTSTTISRQQLLTPYPEFSGVSSTSYEGYSWYHSLQLKLERRFSKGFSVLANYTFSKFMQATELLNAADPQPVRVISDLDAPHRISVSGILELSFGKHSRPGSNWSGVAAKFIGGWQISGIWTRQSGFPLGFGNVIYYGTAPIAIPGDQQSPAHWFNTTGFETAAAKQLASNVRTFPLRFSTVRGDAPNNVDLQLVKGVKIREGKTLQFKVAALNSLNHPLLPNANTTPTSTSFGMIIASTQANYPRRLELTLRFVF